MLAAHDPVDHVLPHAFFKLLPTNLNFGQSELPLLGFPLSNEFYFTNQLLMTLVAAGLCLLLFPRLARAYGAGGAEPTPPRGTLMNLFEALLQFIREEVARPVLKHRTDQFMPFLWTLFFFILFCNLLGLIPLADVIQLVTFGKVKYIGGTATGNLAITGGLAICAFCMIHVSGIGEIYHALRAGTYGHHPHEEHKGHEGAVGHEAGVAASLAHGVGDEDTPETAHTQGAGEHAHGAAVQRGRSAGQAALLALPLYLWNFAPHVFAKQDRQPPAGLRVIMVPVFAVLLALEFGGIFSLLAGSGATRLGQVVGGVIGLLVGFVGAGLRLMDLVDLLMWGFLLLLEFIGAIIRPFALMIRLFANMIAGHIVLASILFLIFATKTVAMGLFVGVISTLGCAALNVLELFVAFLQAYIFVFLTTLFISMAVAPEH